MSSLNLIPVFMVGLLGGLHCIGMCGGIVSAFSAASPSRRAFPVIVAVQGAGRVPAVRTAAGGLVFATAYNA
ncbi:MAG: cytochrome biosis protein, partial [Burkholderiales bacterium]|nr:cytochrome biosis protein [Burkholderiales bacterium]